MDPQIDGIIGGKWIIDDYPDIYFDYISTQKHVVNSYWKVIDRAILMKTHNLYSLGEIRNM